MVQSPRIEPRSLTAWHVAAIALIAAAFRMPLWVARTHLTFDEGVFLASVDLAHSGLAQYRDFFSSQGPLFIPLLQLGDLAAFGDPRGARSIAVASGAVIAVAVYLIATRFTSSARAFALAVVVAASGAILHAAGPVQSEGPALALALTALAIAIRRDDAAGAVLTGALLGAAVATKSLHVLPTALVIAVVIGYRRQWLNLAYTTLSALAIALGSALFFGVERVWDQYVMFHLAKDNSTNIFENVANLARFLFEGDLVLVVLAIASLLLLRRSEPTMAPRRRSDLPPWLGIFWMGSTLVLLVGFTTIDSGFVRVTAFLIPPLVLLIAKHSRLNSRVLLAAALAAVALQAVTTNFDRDPPPEMSAAVAVIETLDPGRPIVGDDPGIIWAARRLSHPDTVDPSYARFETGYLTPETVVRAMSEPGTCAFLATSGRFEAAGIQASPLYEASTVEGVSIRPGC